MGKLTDNDRRFGPITYARASWNPLRLVFSTGGDDDDGEPRNSITGYAFGWVARIYLPTLMQPYRIKHIATTWDAATVERLGRNYYFETFPRDYGFCLNDGHFIVYLGPQTHDSLTTKSWSRFLPWTQWRFFRHTFYDLAGEVHWTQRARDAKPFRTHGYDEQHRAKEACPSASFVIEDFDGQTIIAKTIIEQREWKFGEGWFKWLSLFRKDMVRRSLDIDFSKEVGPDKGSWKGGTLGHSIDMLPGELHEAAFRRYCDNEQRAKHGKYRIKFIGMESDAVGQKA